MLASKEAHEGLLTMEKVRSSPSASVAAGVKLKLWPTVTCGVGEPAICGAAFVSDGELSGSLGSAGCSTAGGVTGVLGWFDGSSATGAEPVFESWSLQAASPASVRTHRTPRAKP